MIVDEPHYVYDPRRAQWLTAAGTWSPKFVDARKFASWRDANSARYLLDGDADLYVTKSERLPSMERRR